MRCFRIRALVLAFCLVALISACSKTPSSASAEATSPELVELTKQVRRYAFEKRKLPENLEDLVSAGYVRSIPPAPAGKKYSIEAKRAEVILVDQ